MERRSSRADLVGRRVGRYSVISHLASGGMSELYVARQEAVGGFEKNLVIKVLQDRYAQHPRVMRMFLDEARLAAKLNHPSIVHVYDVAEEDGTKFIAMEYIHGETLTDIIIRGIEAGKFLPLEHALHIVSQAAAGLDYAHRRHEPTGALLRIVHRDVSPSNIMVSFEGQTKIIDFGIALVQDQIREESGMHPGKPSYMSPEQVAGAAVDYRSDIFSLGIILFEITLAQRLWRGPAEEVKRRIVSEPIPPPTSIRRDYPPALELIVMRALEKRPEDRYQSAEELRQDLEEVITASGFRSGAQRVAVYLREIFPVRASQSDEGVVQPRPPGNADSVPLPMVAGAGADPPGAAPAPPMESAIAATIAPSATTTATAAAPVVAAVPVPHGPSNAKLALGAALITFVLVTVVVLLGRSRRPEVAPAPPPVAAVTEPGHAPRAALPPSASAHSEPAPSLAKISTPAKAPPAPAATHPALTHTTTHAASTHATATPSRSPTFTADRAHYHRSRHPLAASESSSRATAAANSNSPSDVPSAPSPAPESPRSTLPAEASSVRGAARPAAALPPPPESTAVPSGSSSGPSAPPGFVDSKSVTAVVRAHAGEVQDCFDRALMERADLRGRVAVRASIDPGGHVLSVTPTAVMDGGGRLQTCIVGAFQRWTFPPPTGGVKGIVTYSFSFE